VSKNKKGSARNKFRVYSRFCTLIEKSMASSRAPKELRGKKGWEALKETACLYPEIISPMNNLILSAEVQWEKNGMNALFVLQKDIDALLKGKYSLNKLPAMFTPYKAFTICLPAEFQVNGIKPGASLWPRLKIWWITVLVCAMCSND